MWACGYIATLLSKFVNQGAAVCKSKGLGLAKRFAEIGSWIGPHTGAARMLAQAASSPSISAVSELPITPVHTQIRAT